MMHEIPEIERVRGASISATIMAGFGAAWLALGMVSAGFRIHIAVLLVLPVCLLVAALGVAVRRRWMTMFEGKDAAGAWDCGYPDGRYLESRNAEKRYAEKRRRMRAFTVVNVVQWLAIFGATNLLRALHLDAWTIAAIVLIVGAHFLPLASIFQARQHLITGVAMMLCAAAAIVLPVSIRDTVECVMAGVILWVSAAVALYAAFRMTPWWTSVISAEFRGCQTMWTAREKTE